MSASQDVTPLSNVSCRILVLAPRISQANSCIYRIQNSGKAGSLLENSNDKSPSSNPFELSSGLIKIPWTITNKYYSALVHFAAHRMHGLSPHQVQNIPAIIFVWSQGESYKHHVERIAQDLSGFEPEVCLAVRLARASSRSASPTSDEEGEEEDDGEIDGFLSSRGFEYIDATEKHTEQEGSESDAWSNEIPGMERVLDALSTIMWPSMQPTIRQAQQSPQTREREHALLDWANASHDNGLTEIEDIVANSSEQLSERTKAMKLEMQELARWLEEDDALRDDPWKSTITSGGMSTSPTEMGLGDKTPGTIDTFGFDDDFTVFVSAPAFDPSATVSGCSTPEVPTDGLAAPHAGSLYHSLGSVSDFGGSEDGRVVDDDDDLPTKEEIMATSSQIFGPPKFPLSPTIETRPDTSKASNSSDHNPPGTTVSKASLDEDVDAFATEANGVGSYHMEHFDLTKVLGTLQEMKTEISAIEDEGERRKAAARVALGLVYGLEADTELL